MEAIDNNKYEPTEELPISESKAENPVVTDSPNAATEPTVPKIVNIPKSSDIPSEINIVADLINNHLVQGFIMAEILGCPKGKKMRGNNVWNSRF